MFNNRYEIVELESGEFAIQKTWVETASLTYAFSPLRLMQKIVIRFTSIENARVWMKVNAPDQVKRIIE